MDIFYPGDHVRFLDFTGDAVVISVKGNMANVRTTDGFEMPYLIDKLVKINTEGGKATQIFNTERGSNPTLGKFGLYIAYEKNLSSQYSLSFINRSSYHLLVVVSEEKQNIKSVQIESGTHQVIIERGAGRIEKWKELQFQIMYFQYGETMQPSIQFSHRPDPTTFEQHRKMAPILGRECILYQLDDELWKVEQQHLSQQIQGAFKGQKISGFAGLKKEIVPDVVDLHFDAIPDAPILHSGGEILQFQVRFFERKLDEAIIAGKNKIVFIHGVGDGVLKKEIQKSAANNPRVSHTGKADELKYGNGATFIKFK